MGDDPYHITTTMRRITLQDLHIDLERVNEIHKSRHPGKDQDTVGVIILIRHTGKGYTLALISNRPAKDFPDSNAPILPKREMSAYLQGIIAGASL